MGNYSVRLQADINYVQGRQQARGRLRCIPHFCAGRGAHDLYSGQESMRII